MISKSMLLREKLTKGKWLSVSAKLQKPFESITLNFMEYNKTTPENSAILVQFEYKHKQFMLKINQVNFLNI